MQAEGTAPALLPKVTGSFIPPPVFIPGSSGAALQADGLGGPIPWSARAVISISIFCSSVGWVTQVSPQKRLTSAGGYDGEG